MRTAMKKYAPVAGNAMVAMAAVGLVTGCGDTVSGEPAAGGSSTTATEQNVEWNPCSELPDEALRATGADPASKDTDVDAPGDKAAFRICSWDANDGPYYVSVGSSTFSQDRWSENTAVTGISPVDINGRSGLTFYPSTGESPMRLCYVSLPTEHGLAFVSVSWRYSQRDSLPESPPCGVAVQHATTLEPYLPK